MKKKIHLNLLLFTPKYLFMRKLTNPASVSETIIESIKNDRKTMSLNTLVFKHNLPYEFISKVCKGIPRVEKENENGDSSAIRAILTKEKQTFQGML